MENDTRILIEPDAESVIKDVTQLLAGEYKVINITKADNGYIVTAITVSTQQIFG